MSNEEVLTTLQQSLCQLGSANHRQRVSQCWENAFWGRLPPLAAKHSELSRSLSKNLQKPQYITQHPTQTPKEMQNTPHRYSYTQAQAKPPFRGPSGQKGPEQNNQNFRKQLDQRRTSGATAGPASKQSCSKTTLVPFAMAKDHKRPGCYRYSSRVQNRFSHNTLAKTCSKDDSCWEEFTLNATRDNQTRRKGGYNPRTSGTHTAQPNIL